MDAIESGRCFARNITGAANVSLRDVPQHLLRHFFWEDVSLVIALSDMCKKFLSRLVVESIESSFAGHDIPCPAVPDSFSLEEKNVLVGNGGAFVTITEGHALRGCIGTIIAHEPLFQNVWRMAKSAAFADPRFPPLSHSEWKNCSLEISVLSTPSLCPDLHAIEIGRHGLILRYLGHTGVFLPQVPVEQGWNLNQYLTHLCYKAGLTEDVLKKKETEIYWYEANVFPVERP